MSIQSTRFRLKLKKVIYIAAIWLFLSIFQVFYDYFIVISFNEDPSVYRLVPILIANSVIGLFAGGLAGLLIINVIEPWLRKLPFWQALFYLFLLYSVSGFLLLSLGNLLFQCIIQGLPPSHPSVLDGVISYLTNVDFAKHFISWGIIFIGTIISILIYDKYGPGNFRNLLLGRYFHPRTEERIFMFLDIRSSTTVAEKLGDRQYFNFIHDFINDATEPIIYARGEIYQYIGDEIVVSWKMENGLEDANCLQCFFAIKMAIEEAKERYQKKYGVIPDFKAGLHYGSVISGEIGTVKKEIAFSGDVLNTASRIQNECNKHQLDLLLSDDLLALLPLDKNYSIKSIGKIQLRGKAEGVGLSTVVEEG